MALTETFKWNFPQPNETRVSSIKGEILTKKRRYFMRTSHTRNGVYHNAFYYALLIIFISIFLGLTACSDDGTSSSSSSSSNPTSLVNKENEVWENIAAPQIIDHYHKNGKLYGLYKDYRDNSYTHDGFSCDYEIKGDTLIWFNTPEDWEVREIHYLWEITNKILTLRELDSQSGKIKSIPPEQYKLAKGKINL